jgi:hypothetical protein
LSALVNGSSPLPASADASFAEAIGRVAFPPSVTDQSVDLRTQCADHIFHLAWRRLHCLRHPL